MIQIGKARHACRWFAAASFSFLSVPAMAQQPNAASAEPPSGFVTAVESTKPLAYYRLEATSGKSETGDTLYQPSGGVEVFGSCAPIGDPQNHCLKLNGKDGWISTTQKGGVAGAGSIMAWINLAELPSKENHFFYIAGESEVGNDLDLQVETDDTVHFYTAAGSNINYTPEAGSLIDRWHMVVATFDTESHVRAIYWDGKAVKHDQDAGKPDKNNAFTIGDSPVFSDRFFDGAIDEVALWSRSLTAAEIATIYNAAVSSPGEPLSSASHATPSLVQVGGRIAEANLIKKVRPVYPAEAKAARVQGTVEFTAIISKEGTVRSLQLVRGHPLLVDAARDAIMQWQYRPMLLNGQPVAVRTDIIINFSFSIRQ
jgi:TonB family protein